MKILLSGICGFAGSAIARGLVEARAGWKLAGFDNLSRRGSEMNVEPLRALGVDVRVGDVRDEAFLASLPPADWIIDCAANPSVLAGVDGSSSSRDLVDINLKGTWHLLELCRAWTAGFLLLSTSRVYSIPELAALPFARTATRFELIDGQRGPGWSGAGITEDFSTRPPVSLYGATKLASEVLALEFGAAYGFPVWINRCGVLAGAGQFGRADQGIFSYWIHSWLAGRPLRYMGFRGTGCQVRDALHPAGLVPLFLRQIEKSGADVPRISNVGGGASRAISLRELSDWCRETLGPSLSETSLASAPPETRPFDIPWMVLDSSAAAANWLWEPGHSQEEILMEIATHARAHPDWLDRVG